jgi:hypothetical protein
MEAVRSGSIRDIPDGQTSIQQRRGQLARTPTESNLIEDRMHRVYLPRSSSSPAENRSSETVDKVRMRVAKDIEERQDKMEEYIKQFALTIRRSETTV